MPWKIIDIEAEIEKRCNEDLEFKKEWEESRMEYELLGQLTKLYNQKGWTIDELAEKSGEDKQLISEIIEERSERLSVTALYRLANAFDVDVDIKFIPRQIN